MGQRPSPEEVEEERGPGTWIRLDRQWDEELRRMNEVRDEGLWLGSINDPVARGEKTSGVVAVSIWVSSCWWCGMEVL